MATATAFPFKAIERWKSISRIPKHVRLVVCRAWSDQNSSQELLILFCCNRRTAAAAKSISYSRRLWCVFGLLEGREGSCPNVENKVKRGVSKTTHHLLPNSNYISIFYHFLTSYTQMQHIVCLLSFANLFEDIRWKVLLKVTTITILFDVVVTLAEFERIVTTISCRTLTF